jgi:hypothetical protein
MSLFILNFPRLLGAAESEPRVCGELPINRMKRGRIQVLSCRRWYLRENVSIREIARRTKLSRNTIRKYLMDGALEPAYPKTSDAVTLTDSWFWSGVSHLLQAQVTCSYRLKALARNIR